MGVEEMRTEVFQRTVRSLAVELPEDGWREVLEAPDAFLDRIAGELKKMDLGGAPDPAGISTEMSQGRKKRRPKAGRPEKKVRTKRAKLIRGITCPKCGQGCISDRGLSIHMVRMHGTARAAERSSTPGTRDSDAGAMSVQACSDPSTNALCG